MPRPIETAAPVLLVAGSSLFVGGAVANWLHNVEDHFAVRSLGWKLLPLSSVGHLGGLSTVAAGVAISL